MLFVFATMVLLFTLPALTGLVLGEPHAVARWVSRALPVWVVPPAVMFLCSRSAPRPTPALRLLSWKDAEQHAPWNAMLLVAGAVAMTDAVTQFGFVEFMGGIVRNLGIGATALSYLTAGLVAGTTNLISGTAAAALHCSIFIPAAVQIGYNLASIAVLIANVALGLVFPWAGSRGGHRVCLWRGQYGADDQDRRRRHRGIHRHRRHDAPHDGGAPVSFAVDTCPGTRT